MACLLSFGAMRRRAAHLVKYLIDECVDAEIEIHEIRADPVVVHELSGSKTEAGVVHRGIVITADANCRGRLELHRALREA